MSFMKRNCGCLIQLQENKLKLLLLFNLEIIIYRINNKKNNIKMYNKCTRPIIIIFFFVEWPACGRYLVRILSSLCFIFYFFLANKVLLLLVLFFFM